jgi:hypothetical protein
MRCYSILSITILLFLSTFVYGQGEWYVAPAEGKSFGKFQRWSKNFGKSSESLLVGDVTGDGRADAVVMNNQTGVCCLFDNAIFRRRQRRRQG